VTLERNTVRAIRNTRKKIHTNARACLCTWHVYQMREFERTYWKMRATGDTRAPDNQREQRSVNATQQQEQQ